MSANKLSFDASVRNLKWFFTNTEGRSITPKEIYFATGRSDRSPEQNKSWLSNKTHGMKHHELFVKKYADGGFHHFSELILTDKGMRALGKHFEPRELEKAPPAVKNIVEVPRKEPVTLQQVTALVDEFNRQNPSWEFELVPKRVKQGDATFI